MIPARLNRLLILAAGGLMLTAGCASPKSPGSADRAPRPIEPAQMTQFDRWTVRSAGREQVDAAIVRQSTLFEYHFDNGRATLTPIGRRDLIVLARHHGTDPWVLSIRQGLASDDLYERRVGAVGEVLAEQGVPDGAVTVIDAPPGGRGQASQDALRIRREGLEAETSGSGGRESVTPLDTTLEDRR